MGSRISTLLLCGLIGVVVASCQSDEETLTVLPDVDPTYVVFPEFNLSYAFEEGYADSANIELETTFKFSGDLLSFSKLEGQIVGSWTIGRYETRRVSGSYVVLDTLVLTSLAVLELSVVGSHDDCISAVFNFMGNGEYAEFDDFTECCMSCDATPENFIGRELKVKLTLGKNSDPLSKTVEGIQAEITEVRVTAVWPELVAD